MTSVMEYVFTDYNGTRPHSSIECLPPDEFEKRWYESADFRNKFLEERNRKEERILKNRMEKKRRRSGGKYLLILFVFCLILR